MTNLPQQDNKSASQAHHVSLLTILLPIILIGLALRVVYGIFTGDQSAIIGGSCILAMIVIFIMPSLWLAERIFRGKLGQHLRGKETYIPIITNKWFSFYLRHENRPWWVILVLFVLGWIISIALIISMMEFQ